MMIDEATRDELIKVLMNPKDGRPTDQELTEVFSGGVDALTAKWRLRFLGYKTIEIELSYVSAIDRGLIKLTLDSWKLEPVQ
jgi:hypothetical protein